MKMFQMLTKCEIKRVKMLTWVRGILHVLGW